LGPGVSRMLDGVLAALRRLDRLSSMSLREIEGKTCSHPRA